ncbi:MAG: hypothetical protein LBR47_06760 [Spirochaetaceae bacterium]|jgi:hypothetical protein|nr:hypothetical protein [Spirochaetaceae bacterium]
MTYKFLQLYDKFKHNFKENLGTKGTNLIIEQIYYECTLFLKGIDKEILNTKIPQKAYFAYKMHNNRSRAINEALYYEDEQVVSDFFISLNTLNWDNLTAEKITAACYKIAISFCSCIDLIKKGDQKTPGTFFEYFIGHIFTLVFGISPRKQIEVLNMENLNSKLPTDFIFDLGLGKAKFHVPVKTSTRERVIQVWAHQRVLDGVYGTGRFIGVLACLSETKVDQSTLEVTEICLPDQWRIYQLFIAQMKRIYYLDIPDKYAELNNWYPPIHVKPLGSFFKEKDELFILN